MTTTATMLLVVDMQKGFVSEKTTHIIPSIRQLIEHFTASAMPAVFTRFINQPLSAHVQWIGWKRLMTVPEVELIDELSNLATHVIDKQGYSVFTPELERLIEAYSVHTIVFCGIATDGCVLKSAVDGFERFIRPLVVEDACASHGGDELHQAGLRLLRRFIGKRQIVTTLDIASELRWHEDLTGKTAAAG